MKKLNLKKKVVSVLTDEEKQFIKGGADVTTSYGECTGFLCCPDKPDEPASMGIGNTCLLSPGCDGTIVFSQYC